MLKQIFLGRKFVEYEFEYKKIKNINMRIRRDGILYVSAPTRMPEKSVEKFMLSHIDFIEQAEIKKAEYKIKTDLENTLSDGSVKRIFGNDYIIKSRISEKPLIYTETNIIYIDIKNIFDEEGKRRLFEKWQKDLFKNAIIELCKEVFAEFSSYGFSFPEIKIRKMTSRWGSCNPVKGIVTFNINLISYPEAVIKSVVYHEFAHFVHPDHSSDFYKTLSLFDPEWKKFRNILNGKK